MNRGHTMKEKSIASGAACFLVKDASLTDFYKSSFYQWLKKEEFTSWGRHGADASIDWVFVNINSKIFAPGLHGIGIAPVVGEHAVTISEFMTIYGIFERYKGLDTLRMNAEEQQNWNQRQAEAHRQILAFWDGLTYEMFREKVKDGLVNDYGRQPDNEVEAFMKKNEAWIRSSFDHKSPIGELLYALFMAW